MARVKRLPPMVFGWYYVALHSIPDRQIVASSTELSALLNTLRSTLKKKTARLHGAYVSSQEVHLAVQIGVEPLSVLIGNVQHVYARILNRAHQQRGSLFKLHHYVLLIQHRLWLVKLVHYIHWIHRLQSPPGGSDDLWWTTDAAYRTGRRQDGLTTNVVLNMLARSAGRDAQLEAYRRVFDQAPKPEDIHLFKHGSVEDPRILGDSDFVQSIWRLGGVTPGRRRRTQPRDQDIETELVRVVELFRGLCDQRLSGRQAERWRAIVTVDAIKSRSRERPLPLVRALCASSLVARRIATPSQAARFLGCGSGPVSAARRRFYERWFAECFGVSHEVLMKPRREVLGRTVGGGLGQRRLAAAQPAPSSSADLLRRFMSGPVARAPRTKAPDSAGR